MIIKTCPRSDCRFYHLKGTKTTPKNNNQFISKNRFETLKNNDSASKKRREAFHEAPPPQDTITLTDIMKEIMAIKARQDLQERNQTPSKSDSQNWRKPESVSLTSNKCSYHTNWVTK